MTFSDCVLCCSRLGQVPGAESYSIAAGHMLGSMNGAIGKRRRAMAIVMAGGQLILQIASETINDYERSEAERLLLRDLAKRSEAVVSQLSKELTQGRGHGISLRARDPTVIVPKSEAFDLYVQLPDKFQEECGCSPGEFAVLLENVMDVMLLCRDIGFEWGKELNQYRRRHDTLCLHSPLYTNTPRTHTHVSVAVHPAHTHHCSGTPRMRASP